VDLIGRQRCGTRHVFGLGFAASFVRQGRGIGRFRVTVGSRFRFRRRFRLGPPWVGPAQKPKGVFWRRRAESARKHRVGRWKGVERLSLSLTCVVAQTAAVCRDRRWTNGTVWGKLSTWNVYLLQFLWPRKVSDGSGADLHDNKPCCRRATLHDGYFFGGKTPTADPHPIKKKTGCRKPFLLGSMALRLGFRGGGAG